MHFDLSQVEAYQWALAIVSAMVIGMSKAGITGLTLMFIPLMAISFGGRASTGLLLPMLCVGDLFAVAWYRRHAEWQYLLKLLPPAVVGLAAGVAVGGRLSDELVPVSAGRDHPGTSGPHGLAGPEQEGAPLPPGLVVRDRGRAGGGFHHHDRQRRGGDNVHLPALDAYAQERVHRDGGLVLSHHQPAEGPPPGVLLGEHQRGYSDLQRDHGARDRGRRRHRHHSGRQEPGLSSPG